MGRGNALNLKESARIAAIALLEQFCASTASQTISLGWKRMGIKNYVHIFTILAKGMAIVPKKLDN